MNKRTQGKLKVSGTGYICADDGKVVATEIHLQDAKHIVKCWNSHDELLAALKAIIRADDAGELTSEEIDAGRAAIAKAKGE